MVVPGRTTAAKDLVDFEEFCVLVREDQKADLIDGVIYTASPENLEANELGAWLLWVMLGFVDEKQLGKVYYSRVAFRLSNHRAPEPDIAFVAAARAQLGKRGFFDGAPDLAIEIVSPESVERDYEEKRELYRDAGVREYWIIDEELSKVTLLKLSADGTYAEAAPAEGRLESSVLPGFHLRPEWIFTLPRPSKAGILAILLQS